MVERERRQHERVKNLRSWKDVAEQTERVYRAIIVKNDKQSNNPSRYSSISFSMTRLYSKIERYGHLRWYEYLIGAGVVVLLEVAGWFSGPASARDQV